MKRRTKRTPVPSGRLPGLSLFESNKIRHCVGQIDDLKDPNTFASALVLEAKGIFRALGNTKAVKALDVALMESGGG
jgi:hypothetical protein